MIFVFKASRKIWVLQVVSRRVWGELAVWGTKGIHGPLKILRQPCGFRLTHPWGGVGFCWDMGVGAEAGSKPEEK